MKVKLFCIVFILILIACSRKIYISKIPVILRDTIVFIPSNNDTVLIKSTTNINKIYHEDYYLTTFYELYNMIEGNDSINFKKAVYMTENAFLDNKLNYNEYNYQISFLSKLTKEFSRKNKLVNYKLDDSLQVLLSAAIFKVMTDTLYSDDSIIISLPFRYDFDDCFAEKHWENMFVTKLLATNKGNCHSLPFLYKIIAEELNVKAYLSFVPNHIYIKQKCKKTGWYNTELTNGMFPGDAWIMASGYVSTASIVSGIYMDTLSEKQSIVVCLNDLAKGYMRRFKKPNLNFVLKCCNEGLKYYPNYAELLLLKAETLNVIYQNIDNKNEINVQSDEIQNSYKDMEETYALLAKLDYREIPDTMYYEWMSSMERDKNNYQNNKMESIIKK